MRLACDFQRVPERADQAVVRQCVIGGRRRHAPDRFGPGGVTPPSSDHMHVQLRNHIAERGDVELLAFGEGLERL